LSTVSFAGTARGKKFLDKKNEMPKHLRSLKNVLEVREIYRRLSNEAERNDGEHNKAFVR
jgi:hypothetical protein